MKKTTLRIGTSGWSYRGWKGRFYPEDLPASQHLAFMAKQFSTVEVNNTFYHLVSAEAVRTWRKAVPEDFVFACKASRFLTHMKKLKDHGPGLKRFLTPIKELKEKLGPILFQLPPRWKANADRLEEFVSHLPKGYRFTFEFRDPTWFNDEILAILRKHNAALCLFDIDGKQSPIEVTADFVYIRLHGPGARYKGSYDDRTLAAWARRIGGWRREGRDVYCYFDNDEKAYAPKDASRLNNKLS